MTFIPHMQTLQGEELLSFANTKYTMVSFFSLLFPLVPRSPFRMCGWGGQFGVYVLILLILLFLQSSFESESQSYNVVNSFPDGFE